MDEQRAGRDSRAAAERLTASYSPVSDSPVSGLLTSGSPASSLPVSGPPASSPPASGPPAWPVASLGTAPVNGGPVSGRARVDGVGASTGDLPNMSGTKPSSRTYRAGDAPVSAPPTVADIPATGDTAPDDADSDADAPRDNSDDRLAASDVTPGRSEDAAIHGERRWAQASAAVAADRKVDASGMRALSWGTGHARLYRAGLGAVSDEERALNPHPDGPPHLSHRTPQDPAPADPHPATAHPADPHPADPPHPEPSPDPGSPDPGSPDPGQPGPGHPDPGQPEPGHPDPTRPDEPPMPSPYPQPAPTPHPEPEPYTPTPFPPTPQPGPEPQPGPQPGPFPPGPPVPPDPVPPTPVPPGPVPPIPVPPGPVPPIPVPPGPVPGPPAPGPIPPMPMFPPTRHLEGHLDGEVPHSSGHTGGDSAAAGLPGDGGAAPPQGASPYTPDRAGTHGAGETAYAGGGSAYTTSDNPVIPSHDEIESVRLSTNTRRGVSDEPVDLPSGVVYPSSLPPQQGTVYSARQRSAGDMTIAMPNGYNPAVENSGSLTGHILGAGWTDDTTPQMTRRKNNKGVAMIALVFALIIGGAVLMVFFAHDLFSTLFGALF